MSCQPRRFSDLRAASTPTIVHDDEDTIDRVLARLASSRDGRLLAAWLKAEVQAPQHIGATDAQLREAEGARRLANRIIEMAEGSATVR